MNRAAVRTETAAPGHAHLGRELPPRAQVGVLGRPAIRAVERLRPARRGFLLDEAGNSIYDMPASRKNYSNTLAFRFGGQYHAFRWMTARMGMYVDESPVSSDYLNPETPR